MPPDTCPNCRMPVQPYDQFCGKCGFKLSKPVFDCLVRYFESEQVEFDKDAENDTLSFVMEGTNGDLLCSTTVDGPAGAVVVESKAPVIVPFDKVAAVMEFVVRANWQRPVGSFELDLDSREVRYRSSIPFRGIELTDQTFREAIGYNLAAMDIYLPGLLDVINGKSTPAAAITKAESEL